MHKALLLSSLVFVLGASLYASPEQKQEISSPRPLRISVRHIEGKGIGYSEGYTTIETFFAPIHHLDTWIPFLDLRAHIFNDGFPAINAGAGLRYAGNSIWGINAYYDYRETSHSRYNQIALGLESLGKKWDYRINGYLPVGSKESSYYHFQFSHFTGHSMILSRQYEFALKGINAEVGSHFFKIRHAPAYIAAGPYYLSGAGKDAIGGSLRLSFDCFKYCKVEGISSYDTLFHGAVQGQFSLNIPLGPHKELKPKNKKTAKQRKRLFTQALERVDRAEIIPVSHKKSYASAINPSTHEPYVFWFVDNTAVGSGQGTYEHPFSLLASAESESKPYDVTYVFSGDGTKQNLNTGFIMKKNQRLFGAGIKQTLPTEQKHSCIPITIPKQSHSFPTIALDIDPGVGHEVAVIVLEDTCEVAGISITSATSFSGRKVAAIAGGPVTFLSSSVVGVKNPSLHDNIISGSYTQSGIYLHNCQKDILIEGNTISYTTADSAIFLVNNVDLLPINAYIADNIITNIAGDLTSPSGSGILFKNTQGLTISEQKLAITDNVIHTVSAYGVIFVNEGTTKINAGLQSIDVLGNTINKVVDHGIYIANGGIMDIPLQQVVVSGNQVIDCADGRGIFVENNGDDISITSQAINIIGNKIAFTSLEGISVINFNTVDITSQITAITSNIISIADTNGISFSNNFSITPVEQITNISFNKIDSCLDSGIFVQNSGSSQYPTCMKIYDNKVESALLNGIKAVNLLSSKTNLAIAENNIANVSSASSVFVQTKNISSICADITNNKAEGALSFDQQGSSLLFVEPLTDNTFTEVIGSFIPVSQNTCSCEDN
jgi:hypothetical protein